MGEQVGNWRKASYSGNGGEQCVEVGSAGASVQVRDTQDRGGVTLSVGGATWSAFVGTFR
jgi:hypothetical protein